jgi:PAS domain S-box-containing protein
MKFKINYSKSNKQPPGSIKISLPFAQFYSLSPDPTLITNKAGEIVYVNPAWEKHTGYTSKEVVGKNPSFLGSGKTPKELYIKLWTALMKGKSFTTEDVIDKKKDGTEYQIRSKFYPIQDKKETIYFIQVMHDITKQKDYETMQKSFLSMAGHELKTPITTLKLLTQLLRKKVELYEKGDNSFEVLDNEFDRLTDLINQMLDLSRLETGKMAITPKIVTVTKIIMNTINKIQLLSEKHKIKFVKTGEYRVFADEYRIEQVLTNLLTNAIKYSSKKTPVYISIQKRDKKVIISVQDLGHGIQKNKLPHIFEKFYQVHDGGKIGFGLGLYISSEIIKAHNEKLWVESEEGQGSTFYFSLPIANLK